MNYEILKDVFQKHGFSTKYFDNSTSASCYLSEILHGKTIGFGGSVTIKEMGLFETLSKNNVVVWHHNIQGNEIKNLASHTKIYICSANAVSETGELVNIDGAGNRIAMMLFGPEKVFYIVGKNKIVNDLPSALYRAKNIAAPKTAQKQKVGTPCSVKGDRCYDCKSKQRICNCTIILERAPNCTPSEILFIDEDLGH